MPDWRSDVANRCLDAARLISDAAQSSWAAWAALLLPWWGAWWWYALARGFRLERPWAVFRVVMIPCLLAALIVMVLHPTVLRSVL